jgi:hypothetical protein
MADWIKGLGYYVPPELRNLGASVKALGNVLRPNPILNNPNVANLLRTPSVAGVGKVLSDLAITGAEVIPGGKIVTTPIKKVSKIISPKEAKILDDFVEGKKTIPDTKSTLAKLGKDPDKRQGFDEKHLAYLANKFGIKKSAKELAKGPANKRGGWREFIDLETGLPKIKKDPSIPREALHPAYRKSVRRYAPHPKSPVGKASRHQKKVKTVVDDFTTLKNKMESSALTLEEIIDPKNKLAKGTRHYKRVGKFEKYADDIKAVDEDLHDFFVKEIGDYKLGEVSTKKSVRGSTALEKRRRKLSKTKAAKSADIKIADLHRAHSTMQTRLQKINDLYATGKITKAEFQNLRKPQYLLLNPENQAHRTLENTLDRLLNRRVGLKEKNKWDALNTTSKKIDDLTKEMTDMRVESVLWDPIKEKLRTFGLRPSDLDIVKTKRGLELTEQIPRKYNQGGIASISHLTRPI